MPSNIREMMEALREAAAKAWPGEWRATVLTAQTASEGPDIGFVDGPPPVTRDRMLGFRPADATYIALANPQTLTLLLQHVEKLEGALSEAERFMAYFAGETEGIFVGSGTPATCVANIRDALSQGGAA